VGPVIARWPDPIAPFASEVSMTKKLADFKIPTVRRAIRIAHAQGLVIDSYDIKADGSIHIELRNYEVTPDGTVSASTRRRRDEAPIQ
jgi:hypothetical protein